jgi:hypothetical protein
VASFKTIEQVTDDFPNTFVGIRNIQAEAAVKQVPQKFSKKIQLTPQVEIQLIKITSLTHHRHYVFELRT